MSSTLMLLKLLRTCHCERCRHLYETHSDLEDEDDTSINQDSFDGLGPDEAVDGDEDDAVTRQGRREVEHVRTGDVEHSTMLGGDETGEGDDDFMEGDMGIRRTKFANGKNIEEITMSDIVLDPDGTITYYWLGIMTISVIYNIIVVILRLAFEEMRDPVIQDSVFYVFDTICDLAYLIDIIIYHRVSFYNDGCLVLDPNKIKEKYHSSRKFKMDVLAILPYGSMYSFISGAGSVFCFDPVQWVTGDVHILLVRFPRLLKYSTMAKFFDLTDSRTRNPNLVRAFKLTLNLWVVIHWIGCIYYVLSEHEGLGSNSWVYPSGEEYAYFSRKYIRVTYWSLMTLTTIGERPPPETDLEFVFTGFTFLIGVFVFAAVVGNVGDVISNMNAAKTDFQSKMDQIKSYMMHRNVDEKLQSRVKKWADYTWKRSSVDEPSLLQLLPDRLRTEIAINVHLDTLKEVEIFEKCEEGLLRELVLKLRPQVYSPGDYICRIGEIGREMYIVNHGKVEISLPEGPNNEPSVIAKLPRGKYFGEISLLKMDDGQNRRTADAKAVGYTELLRLSRRDLMSALTEYPSAKRILEEIAYKRFEKTKSECSRRVSQTDNPGNDNVSNQRPQKLLRIIQSKNFQDLLAQRTKEQNEMYNILKELKTFDSQNTKGKIESLSEENKKLQAELEQNNQEMATLKRKLASLQKRKRSSVYVSPMQTNNKPVDRTQTHGHNNVDPNDFEQSTDDDNNDIAATYITKSKRYLSVDSAYTSTDLSHECYGVSQNNTDTKTDESEKMDIASPKTSPDSDSTCFTKYDEMRSAPKCCASSESGTLTYPHNSKRSRVDSEENKQETYMNSEYPRKFETNSMDKNKNFTHDSYHRSRTHFGETKTKEGKLLENTEEMVPHTDTRFQSYSSTKEQTDHQLICELLQKGIDLNYDNNNEEHINTMHKIQALQLLTEDNEYETEHSVHSEDNTSDDLSDYDL